MCAELHKIAPITSASQLRPSRISLNIPHDPDLPTTSPSIAATVVFYTLTINTEVTIHTYATKAVANTWINTKRAFEPFNRALIRVKALS